MVSWDDMEQVGSLPRIMSLASERLPEGVHDHIAGGAGSEATIQRNALAFDSLAFRPRVLRDMSDICARTQILDYDWRLPVALAPIGSLHTLFPDAAAAALRAAGRFGIPAFVSSVASPGPLDLAGEGQGPKIMQLYIRDEPVEIRELVTKARNAGYAALAVTVDSAYYGIRDRQRLGKWQPPATLRGGRAFQAKLTWDMLDDIIDAAAPMPVFLKGIQTGEDAELAVKKGIETIYVSNHGGRQLDHCRATLDVLREVRATVGDGPTVILDGGIRRGTDVVKALALGADGVAIGRLTAWALAVGGENGVVRMLELLEEEIRNALALLGAARIADLSPAFVADVAPLR